MEGYNAIALYEVANCWVRNVSWLGEHGASTGAGPALGTLRLGCLTPVTQYAPPCAAHGLLSEPQSHHPYLCHSSTFVQVRTINADNGVLVNGADFVSVQGATAEFTKPR